MPTRLATRSASKPEDATPRTTRTMSRATVTRGKKAEVAGDEDEMLAKEMERILKVSEPEPQARITKGRSTTTVAAKGKAKDVEEAPIKKTVTAPSRTTVKAPTASTSTTTTARKATVRTTAVSDVAEPAVSSRRTTSSTKPASTAQTSSTAPERRTAATTSRSTTSKAVGTSRPSESISKVTKPTAIAASDDLKPRTSITTVVKPRTTTSTEKPSTSGSSSSRPPTTGPSTVKASSTKPVVPTMSTSSRPTASSSNIKSTSATTARQPVASSSRLAAPAPTQSAPSVSRSAALTRPKISVKGKEKEMVIQELSLSEHPWMDPTTSRSQYASDAMAAIKASILSLGTAYKAGYQYGSSKDDWTGERVDKELAICDAALGVLRRMDENGELGSKGLEVEKAGQAIIGRSITLGMPRRAFDQLVAAREGILRQYKHSDTPIPRTSIPVASESTNRLNSKWLECCWLPCPQEPKISDQLRAVFVQQIASAWSCLIGIEGYGYDLPPFVELMPLPTAPDGWLHPLQIARLDPPRMHCGSMLALTKRFQHIPMSAPHWAHVFTVLLSGYIVMVTEGETTSPGLQSLRPPSQLWETLKKWLVAYINHTDVEVATRRVEVAAKMVSDILQWAEGVIDSRKESRQGWFSGKAFTDLVDFWIDVSRKSRNPAYVARALSLMSGSTSLDQTSAMDVDMTSTLSLTERDAALTQLFGQSSLIETLLAEDAKPKQKEIDDALQALRWDVFGLAVGDLSNTKHETEQFAKAYRMYTRIRALVVKLHNSLDESVRGPSRTCLLEGASAVEQALTRTILVEMSLYTSFINSAIAAIDHALVRLPSSMNESEIIAVIERGERICWLSKGPDDRWSCLRSLGNAVISLAHTLQYKYNLPQTATRVGRQGIDIATAALDAYLLGEKLGSTEVEETYKNRRRAYDTLCVSLLAISDREGAITAGAQMLASASPRLVEQLDAADERQTAKVVFKDLEFFNVERLSYSICSELEPIGTEAVNKRVAIIIQELKEGRNYPIKVVSLIAERILESMIARGFKAEHMELAYVIGEEILKTLDKDSQAIRRLRILSRLMLLTSSFGTRQADFDQLVKKARSEIDILRSRPDANSVLNAEYHAVVLMLQAFQTYQIKEQAAQDVISLATEVIQELRQLLIPPTRSPAPASPNVKKTAVSSGSIKFPKKGQEPVSSRSVSVSGHPKTAAKVVVLKKRRSNVIPITEFDDIALLATMLSSLVSLLGLLGDVMAQVDGIKVLRALLRYREDMLNDYVIHSGELASLYSKLGKHTRATNVFTQALRTATDNPKLVTPATLVVLHLRHCDHLASSGEEAQALKAYASAEEVFLTLTPTTLGTYRDRLADKNAGLHRLALAHRALATIRLSQDDAAGAIRHRKAIVVLLSASITSTAAIAMNKPNLEPKKEDDNPFTVPPPAPEKTGANEPSKEATIAAKSTSVHPFTNKYTAGIHWKGAEILIDAYLELANAYAQRGSAADAKYYFAYADVVGKAVRSSAIVARSATKAANLRGRMNKLDEAQEKLTLASGALVVSDGPDAYDLQRVRGDILARQEMTDEAKQVFEEASKGIHGLDTVFSAADALLPSPKKEALARVSLTMSTMRSSKEPLLPSTLSQILRRQAWLFREAGLIKESDELYKQVQLLQSVGDSKAEESYLAGKLALDDAFNHFQSDLFMSSLTESTIAMPMGTPGKKVDHRQSTRHRIQVILEQADAAYQSALELVAGSGKVEDVRQACLSLALLRAFQTSLGQGGARVTSFAADLLASSTSIGLHREILEAIEGKFIDISTGTTDWPTLDGGSLKASTRSQDKEQDAEEDVTTDPALVEYWNGVRTRHTTRSYLSPDGPSYDLSVLPKTWAVVSISVTEDRNTMFISRHQNGHDPLVFCLPLDRQSKREGEEEDVFTFDAGILELKTIIKLSEECSKSSKFVQTEDDKIAWWGTKRELDERMKDLIGNVEFCWLGAFKTIFNPRQSLTTQRLELFRSKIEKVFNLALFGSPHDSKKYGKIRLSNSLLECFATLSSKSRDEEIEDFIYFILDIYQFHGVPVAVSELDLDQVGIDVRTALTEMEASAKPTTTSPADGPEHLLLALDKNTQALPWESMPCLRGRPVSRVPSLPVLLDQVALGNIMQPGSKRRMVNSKKTHFILNPSGDLKVTQGTFESYLTDMKERAGWKGVIGEKPSELEMSRILKDSDLVLYFGHGGGEQYIRGSKVRTLPKCATTFLWGCSSGKLDDQGDLDPAGTAWDYMMAGCPALTATLWDVTDRDIDRYTTSVYRLLGLDPAHVLQQEKPRAEHSKMGLLPLSNQGMGLSTVEAVNLSREECKMTYLTGAAVVHYGIPVYIY